MPCPEASRYQAFWGHLAPVDEGKPRLFHHIGRVGEHERAVDEEGLAGIFPILVEVLEGCLHAHPVEGVVKRMLGETSDVEGIPEVCSFHSVGHGRLHVRHALAEGRLEPCHSMLVGKIRTIEIEIAILGLVVCARQDIVSADPYHLIARLFHGLEKVVVFRPHEVMHGAVPLAWG